MAFRCVVVTPEEQTLDESCTQAILPAHDGLIGILTDRAPLLVKLGAGPLRVDLASGQQRIFFVDGGIAQVKDNNLTVLTTQAMPKEKLDPEAARREHDEAVARPTGNARANEERQKAIDRSRAKQQVAQMR